MESPCFVVLPALSSSWLGISVIKPKECVCDTIRQTEAELTALKLQFLRLKAKNIHYPEARSEQLMCVRAHTIKNNPLKSWNTH